jgi:hypothetical protein
MPAIVAYPVWISQDLFFLDVILDGALCLKS